MKSQANRTARSQPAQPRRIAIAKRVAALDWNRIAADLDDRGCAIAGPLLTADECIALVAAYADGEGFRSRVIMASHGFGRGEYKYFAYPLPAPVAELRTALYAHLAAVANRWNEWLRIEERYPEDHAAFLDRCRRAGQTRPTPLLLHYEAGDYNRLHQDLYGEIAFPIQAAVMLSAPADDFTGGEFVIVEQRPRMQSRAEAVVLGRGEAVIFATRQRPVRGARGFYRANLRHGMSTVRSGRRTMLGIIFHDAR
jgi:hypothetical protein